MAFNKKTISLLLIIFLSISQASLLIPQTSAIGENWLTDYTYRQSHVIVHSAGAGTNYQVPITINYGSGNSSGNIMYANSHCQTDFGDIRITGSDGSTLYNYWVENQTNSNHIDLWVNIQADLSSVDQTIYVYYNKTTGTDTTLSNGPATFPFFDDFSGASLNTTLWTAYQTGTITVSGGLLSMSGTSGLNGNTQFGLGYATRSNSSHFSGGDYYGWIAGWSTYPTGGYANFFLSEVYIASGKWMSSTRDASTSDTWTSSESISVGSYSVTEYRRISSSSNTFYKNGIFQHEHTTHIPTGNLDVNYYCANSGTVWKSDWVLVRKCIASEPYNGDWSGETTNDIAFTFYNNGNATIYVNGSIVANGTSINYASNDVLALSGVVAFNYTFVCWSITNTTTSYNSTDNPLLLTVLDVSTVWFYTEPVSSIVPYIFAAFTFSPSNPTLNSTIIFDASPSNSSSEITDYSWNFGDTTTDNGLTVEHIYSDIGNYTVLLTVTSSAGNASYSQIVNVVDWIDEETSLTNSIAMGLIVALVVAVVIGGIFLYIRGNREDGVNGE